MGKVGQDELNSIKQRDITAGERECVMKMYKKAEKLTEFTYRLCTDP